MYIIQQAVQDMECSWIACRMMYMYEECYKNNTHLVSEWGYLVFWENREQTDALSVTSDVSLEWETLVKLKFRMTALDSEGKQIHFKGSELFLHFSFPQIRTACQR